MSHPFHNHCHHLHNCNHHSHPSPPHPPILGTPTIVGDDAPCGEGGIQPPQHPEHAEPAQVLPTLVHLQELRVVGVHDGDGASNPAGEKQHLNSAILKTYSTLSGVNRTCARTKKQGVISL